MAQADKYIYVPRNAEPSGSLTYPHVGNTLPRIMVLLQYLLQHFYILLHGLMQLDYSHHLHRSCLELPTRVLYLWEGNNRLVDRTKTGSCSWFVRVHDNNCDDGPLHIVASRPCEEQQHSEHIAA